MRRNPCITGVKYLLTPTLSDGMEEREMGRLVIDGNSVYEIDEECVRKEHPPKECGIYEHLETKRNGHDSGRVRAKPRRS